jgi:putative ABC transport system permease protein
MRWIAMATTFNQVDLRTGLDDHVLLLIVSLVVMAALMAIVGVLGLSSTMSTNVVERTREFGVMQTVGATPRAVRSMVVSEGVFIGALSRMFAIVLALPLSAVVNVLLRLVSMPQTIRLGRG